MQDLVGMGWRPELATGILSNLDRIDVLEVIAEDYYETPAGVSALKSLAKQVSVSRASRLLFWNVLRPSPSSPVWTTLYLSFP